MNTTISTYHYSNNVDLRNIGHMIGDYADEVEKLEEENESLKEENERQSNEITELNDRLEELQGKLDEANKALNDMWGEELHEESEVNDELD